jgi:hypothetical protein
MVLDDLSHGFSVELDQSLEHKIGRRYSKDESLEPGMAKKFNVS